MSTIGNIGIGLFILIILWILTLLLFVVAVKIQSNLGWFGIAFSSLVTIVLISIPIDRNKPEYYQDLEVNYRDVTQTVLISFLVFSVIIGFVSFFILHCIESSRPKRIDTWIKTS